MNFEGRLAEAVEILRNLVAFDTTSSRSNLALIDYIRDYLQGHGVRAEIVYNEDRSKANLLATLGPKVDGGVVLSGHTDVVPVEGQDWTTDPFTLSERDGLLYGRGTTDMKGFIAVVLALVPEFLNRDLQRPVHLAFSYDEEVGCLGVQPLLAELPRIFGAQPAVVIVGEPTDMKPINRHKGGRQFETVVTGRAAHSSVPHLGINAILYATELIQFLDGLIDEMRGRAAPELGFEPPYTTLNVGQVHGGTAVNIVAQECRFQWEYRYLPNVDPEEIIGRFNAFVDEEVRPRIKKEDPDADIVTRQISYVRALLAEADSPAEELIISLMGGVLFDAHLFGAVSFGTEAGFFQQAGISAVVIGPGSIAQAHKPDEFVGIDQLGACLRLLERLG